MGKPKFTRIPKMQDLVRQGVPAEAIPTYCALSDYAHNKTGLCFPKMQTLAQTLKRSVRTIQRHLHLLRELGLIQFVERRRNAGRFSSYLYRITFFLFATTGHERPQAKPRPIKRRTKPLRTTPLNPPNETKEAKRGREAARRTEGYEWLFI